MKKSLYLLFTLMALSISYSSYAVVDIRKADVTPSKQEIEKAKADFDKLTKKEKRVKKRKLRKQLKTELKAAKKSGTISTGLLVVIGIFIPPLAMALYDGITNRFWISLLLTLLFFLPGMIYTLIVILND